MLQGMVRAEQDKLVAKVGPLKAKQQVWPSSILNRGKPPKKTLDCFGVLQGKLNAWSPVLSVLAALSDGYERHIPQGDLTLVSSASEFYRFVILKDEDIDRCVGFCPH